MSQILNLNSGGGGGGGATTFNGNTGTALPAAGVINIVGTGPISTAATGNTITISQLGLAPAYTNVTTTPYVVTGTDYYLSVNSSALAITIQLPNAPTALREFVIKDRTGNAATNNITITTVGGTVLIDGATSQLINTNFQSMQLIFNGTSYEIF
jgi:hypothetical protein